MFPQRNKTTAISGKRALFWESHPDTTGGWEFRRGTGGSEEPARAGWLYVAGRVLGSCAWWLYLYNAPSLSRALLLCRATTCHSALGEKCSLCHFLPDLHKFFFLPTLTGAPYREGCLGKHSSQLNQDGQEQIISWGDGRMIS